MTSTWANILPSLGYAAPPRFHPAIWPLTTHSDDDGRLCIGEVPVTDVCVEHRVRR
jgi:diaminopimelate decarboxylase